MVYATFYCILHCQMFHIHKRDRVRNNFLKSDNDLKAIFNKYFYCGILNNLISLRIFIYLGGME